MNSTGCGVRTANSGWIGDALKGSGLVCSGDEQRSLRRVPVREQSPRRHYPIATMCKLLGVCPGLRLLCRR